MSEQTRRRRDFRLLIIGEILLGIALLTGALLLVALSDPTLSWVPTVTGEGGGSEGGGFNYTGVALIVTAFGSLISGVVTSITGLVVALRKPREAASEAAGNKTPG
jgi:multisubunit Na+/H+ antiporter MnhB subunit